MYVFSRAWHEVRRLARSSSRRPIQPRTPRGAARAVVLLGVEGGGLAATFLRLTRRAESGAAHVRVQRTARQGGDDGGGRRDHDPRTGHSLRAPPVAAVIVVVNPLVIDDVLAVYD